MQKLFLFLILVAGILATANAQQQDTQKPRQEGPLSGRWMVTGDYLGTPINAC